MCAVLELNNIVLLVFPSLKFHLLYYFLEECEMGGELEVRCGAQDDPVSTDDG